MGQARIVAIDYGRARVGLAVSDPLSIFAQPTGAYPPKQVLSELEQIAEDDGITLIVLGWPYELDGTEGQSVEAVKAFEKRLKTTLPDVKIVRWDERFTSKEAERAIIASGASRKKRREKGNVDSVAAAILLQSYLDQ